MTKKAFYFILKAFSVFKIFEFLSRLSRSYIKNVFIRKRWLISDFITSQLSLQAIKIHILPNISQDKGNQAIKFGQLIEHNKKNIFLQKQFKKYDKETSPDHFFIFRKALYKVKANGLQLSFKIFRLNWAYIFLISFKLHTMKRNSFILL